MRTGDKQIKDAIRKENSFMDNIKEFLNKSHPTPKIIKIICWTMIIGFLLLECGYAIFLTTSILTDDNSYNSNGRIIGDFKYTITDYSFSRDKHADDNDCYELTVWIKVENMRDYRGVIENINEVIDRNGKEHMGSFFAAIFGHAYKTFYRLEKRTISRKGFLVPTNNPSDYQIKIGNISMSLV